MQKQVTYYLADSTVVEPLVNCWSAWSHVISPVTASLHLLNYQVETLRSYLIDPPAHVAASRTPELVGGPYVEIAPHRAGEVAQLLDNMQRAQSHNIRLASALTEFSNWLVDHAAGESLEAYYQNLPDE